MIIASFILFAPASAENGGATDEPQIAAVVGADVRLCEVCPTFVRVPDAPETLRPIRMVAKYELTWKDYLAAYDAGRCNIPNPNVALRTEPGPNDLLASVDKLRVVWPANKLGPAEVQCYIAWLQEMTSYVVALPSPQEWEWFARAGRVNSKFPWGNDPDPSKEALCGNAAAKNLGYPPHSTGLARQHLVGGVAPGQFPPNDWGLHDIMGSLLELTSVTFSGAEHFKKYPDSKWAAFNKERYYVVLKGGALQHCNWKDQGILTQSNTVIWNGSYRASVAVRLILVDGRQPVGGSRVR